MSLQSNHSLQTRDVRKAFKEKIFLLKTWFHQNQSFPQENNDFEKTFWFPESTFWNEAKGFILKCFYVLHFVSNWHFDFQFHSYIILSWNVSSKWHCSRWIDISTQSKKLSFFLFSHFQIKIFWTFRSGKFSHILTFCPSLGWNER